MGKKRSKGATLLGWFFIITSFTGIVLNSFAMIFHPKFLANYAPSYRVNSELIENISSISALLISLFKFILGINILKLKENWRRIAVYYFLFDIVYLFSWNFFLIDPLRGLCAQIGPIILSGLLLYFITRPRIKEQFE